MIKIRPATILDLEELLSLFVETIRWTCKNYYSADQINAWTSSLEDVSSLKRFLEDQYFLLAEVDHRIVGFGSLENNQHLDFLYVHKDYLRQGIASQIFNELEKEASGRGNSVMTSYVSKTARPFFEARDFRIVRKNTVEIKGISISNYYMTR